MWVHQLVLLVSLAMVVCGGVVSEAGLVGRQGSGALCQSTVTLDFSFDQPQVNCAPCEETLEMVAAGPVYTRNGRLAEMGLMVMVQHNMDGSMTCSLVHDEPDVQLLQSQLQREACGGSSPSTTGSTVTGTGSTVTGTGSTVTGTGSTVTGTGSTVTGTGSTGTGTGSTVTGTGSTVIGTGSTVTVTGSTVTSTGSTVTGTGSTGTGTGSTVTGTGSTVTGTGSTVTGTGSTVTGTGSTVTGTGSTVTGTGSTVTGTGSTVTGTGSTVTGTGSTVTGTGSTVTGTGSTVTGTGSTVTGTGSTVTGTGSTVTGTGSTVTGTGSTVTGTGSTVTGTGSTVTGTGSTVTGTASTVTGPTEETQYPDGTETNPDCAQNAELETTLPTTTIPPTITTTPEPTTRTTLVCPVGWDSFESSCYHVTMNTEGTWEEGKKYCENHGSSYVKISSQSENDFVQGLLMGSTWIGLNDRSKEGTFIWDSDNSVATFMNWSYGEPNGSWLINEDCVEMREDKYFKWNDEGCSSISHFACEKPADLKVITG
ncbi:putative per-hexamer repeat protein 5 isoform X10 [Homarus americanus]|uniref:putative per-hexamer repeat protein 5 isoform X10 n=1 Tax=Homarus americanus TaxID=6706 RepID=UPI001C450DDB|nr:putative per-hexamer repeat protein 5 isoform X10 [Homarus americanus]